jgi:hypothetical protein
MTRVFLAIVGLAYVVLAVWCSLLPGNTSQAVGFSLQSGSGQSEFLTVYGGLELALGALFLRPLWRPATLESSMWACLIVHAGLVLFRTFGFLLYSGIPSTTWGLAVTEWAIFLSAAGLYWLSFCRQKPCSTLL